MIATMMNATLPSSKQQQPAQQQEKISQEGDAAGVEAAQPKGPMMIEAPLALGLEAAYRVTVEFARLRQRHGAGVLRNPQMFGAAGGEMCPSLKRFMVMVERLGYGSVMDVLRSPANYLVAFHGTRAVENLPLILRDGFDPKRRSGQAYGPGEYFDTEGSTASSYQGNTGVYIVTLIVVRDASGAAVKSVTRPSNICVVNNDRDDQKASVELASYCLPIGLAAQYTLQDDAVTHAHSGCEAGVRYSEAETKRRMSSWLAGLLVREERPSDDVAEPAAVEDDTTTAKADADVAGMMERAATAGEVEVSVPLSPLMSRPKTPPVDVSRIVVEERIATPPPAPGTPPVQGLGEERRRRHRRGGMTIALTA